MANPRDRNDDDNQEQRDADQAQDVAEDALNADRHGDPLASTKPPAGSGNGNAPDLVDRMNQMLTSGRVDMAAYAGEPLMDDGDEVMPGTGPGALPDADDDMLGGDPDAIDAVPDTGEDPLAAVASDDHGEGELED